MKSTLLRLTLLCLGALATCACATPPSPNTGASLPAADTAQASDAAEVVDATQDAAPSQGSDAAQVGDAAADLGSDASGPADAAGPSDGGPCNSGSPCDDGDKCTQGDQCVNGSCAGKPIDCTQGLGLCKKGACEPGSGLCLISDKDSACDDGDPCTEADFCVAGACIGYKKEGCCTVNCTGKKCGDNGCGGSCGSCGSGEVCGKGTCVKSTLAGETCADATVISSLPYSHSGSTATAKNDL